MASRSDYLVPMLLGASTGVIVGLLVWRYASKQLAAGLTEGRAKLAQELGVGVAEVDRQIEAGSDRVQAEIRTAVQTLVVPQVITTVRAQLTTAGVTPQMISDLKQALALARRAGIIT